jgi:mono/diheme cytochrome c family protein
MLTKSFIRIFVSSCALAAACAFAQDKDKTEIDPKLLPPASTKQGVTYAADIQPIFQTSCYPCHSAKTPKPKGKLRLDSLDAVLKGGEDGPALVPGDSAKSAIVANVSHLGDPDDYMPPPKNRDHIQPLTKEQIGLIRAWIDQGAK